MIQAIYNTLPDDVKRKVSLHDLKRIADAIYPDSACMCGKPVCEHVCPSLLQHLKIENDELRDLLAAWVSIESDKCRSDHHGVCYEHNHFDLPCPVARAREILSKNNQ